MGFGSIRGGRPRDPEVPTETRGSRRVTNSSTSDPLEIYLLGEVDFDDAQKLQRRLVYDLGERTGGALILCEHPPTISVGRSGSRAHIRPDDDELRERDLPIRWVNR